MSYVTPNRVRGILGVEDIDAPDSVLTTFCEDATNVVIRRISVRILDEEPDYSQGGCDASNRVFYLWNRFISDVNGDGVINASDIHAYTWTDLADEDTKVEVTVASLNPLTGRVVLTVAPTADKYLTFDYSYYRNQVDWEMMELASAYYAAKMWVERELLLVPRNYRVGRVTIKQYESWEVYKKNYERIIDSIMILPMDTVTYKKIMKGARKDTLEDEIEGTSSEYIKDVL